MNVAAFLIAAPVLPEEEMAIAEQFLGERAAESHSFLGQYGAWLIFGAAFLAAVLVMLSMIAGRYRRQRSSASHQDPLFEDDDQDADTFNPAFAEVIIEDGEEPADSHEEARQQPGRPIIGRRPRFGREALAGHPERNDEAQITIGRSSEVAAADASDGNSTARRDDDDLSDTASEDEFDTTTSDADQEREAAPNVVRLRTLEGERRDRHQEEARRRAEAEEQEAARMRAEHDEESRTEPTEPQSAEDVAEQETPAEEAMPRYAFGSGRGLGIDPGYSRSVAEQRQDPPYRGPGGMARGNATSEERPYGAMFQRDDVERAERRQGERINRMRDEFASELSTLKAEQASRLDLIISTIDRKLDRIDKNRQDFLPQNPAPEELMRTIAALGDRVSRLSSTIDGQHHLIRQVSQSVESHSDDPRQIGESLRSVADDIKAMRGELGTAADAMGTLRQDVDTVREHVERLERAVLDRAAHEGSTAVRLADVVRGTLPEGTYEFNAPLSTGETADCLIKYEGLSCRIAIDAGFPMDAFQELPSRDAVRRNLPQAKAAEDGFRRAILRAILESADRCITPDETADMCLLFLPSEAAYTILHDRFPDLVRDSQRARVWLVSPSTLMGTLHLVTSLLPGPNVIAARDAAATQARAREEEDSRLREEVDALRRRAAGLADELDRTRGTLRDLIGGAESLGGQVHTAASSNLSPRAGVGAFENGRPEPDPVHKSASRGSGLGHGHGREAQQTPDWDTPVYRPDRGVVSTRMPGLYNEDRDDPLR